MSDTDPQPTWRERVGAALGRFLAPGAAALSARRRARMFHPDGLTFFVEVTPSTRVPDAFRPLADELAGHGLARFSGALWRRGFEHLDVLGIGLRFRRAEAASPLPDADDQDLLFATIVSPFTMPASPFTTRAGDYFENHSWAVSPFDAPGGRRVKFRITPVVPPTDGGGTREERLLHAVEAGQAQLRLEVRGVFRMRWSPLATLTLTSRAELDQERLRFSPFQDGRGVRPRGLVHALRRAVYPASQAGRGRGRAEVSGARAP